MDRFDKLIDSLKKMPPDVWALIIIAIGAILVLGKCKEEGQAVIAGGLAIFKGHSQ